MVVVFIEILMWVTAIYTVERFTQADHATPLPHPTGWRAVLKRK